MYYRKRILNLKHAREVPIVHPENVPDQENVPHPENARQQAGNAPHTENTTTLADVRHSLLAETTVLDAESLEAFTDVFLQYVQLFDPTTPVEFDLIDEMASASWRLRRLWDVETSTINGQIKLQTNRHPQTALSGALTTVADTPRFHQLSRYQARLHRVYHQALRNLLMLKQRQM